MTALPEFRLEAFFSRWEFKAKYHLTASDAQTLALTELLALADAPDRERWERLTLGYVETRGTAPLLDAIAARYRSVRPEDLLAFAGAEEGLYCAMHALLGPGDHAIVATPNYQSMETVPRSLCETSGVALHEDAHWQLDVDEIAAAIRPNTRVLALNFPNNPTGAVATPELFDAIVALCRKHGLYLFSDEIYRGIERDPRKRLPQAADVYEKGLSLNGLAKAYGLPGLRIGWIACRDRAVLARMEQIKHYLSICNAAPSEVLATIALKASDAILAATLALCKENLAALGAFFAQHADRFEWYEPDGGCVAFPRYLGSEGAQEFCRVAVETAGVLLLPPSIYASELSPVADDRFRIGYGRSGMGQALQALETVL